MPTTHAQGQPILAAQPPNHTGRVLIIANPYSGMGENRQRVGALAQALARRGMQTQECWDPVQRDGLLAQPRQLTHDFDCLVVAGGDGTIAGVIQACRHIPLAVLPMGNENLFARQFGFRKPIDELARAIVGGQWVRADVGRAGDRYFTVMLGAGFDAEVVHRVAQWRADTDDDSLHRVTRMSYVKPILAALKAYRYPTLTLETDQGVVARGAQVLVFNVPRYAMGLRMVPPSAADDGMLDWVVFERPGAISLLWYMRAVMMRRHTHRRDVHLGRAARLRLTAEAPAPLQIDGDAAGATPINIDIAPAAIRVIRM
ncbi:MAG: diacylglycerol kinase family protein [Phycisphaeraceae bacterium]